jgi:DNA-directed RNA polymerase subunit L
MVDLNFKPEFGNIEQIKKIKQAQKEAEMDEYTVRISINGDMKVKIKANPDTSKDKVVDKALEKHFDSLIDWANVDGKVLNK